MTRFCVSPTVPLSARNDRRRLTREHRFKSAAEMAVVFADLPEAIENTVEIARRCAFRPAKRKPILPVFVPESGRTAEEELKAQAQEGLARRLAGAKLFAERGAYDERLDYELGIINRMGFPGYFLIVSDFMKWTRGRGIPVGVRGSGASSLVAWALDITNLDPLRFGLFFERFLNPERLSMPDFDIDFCQERRDEVVRYVRDKYGADRVAQIIALGSLQARAAVRDAGPGAADAAGAGGPHRQADPQSAGQIHFAEGGGGERAASAADRRAGAHRPAAVRDHRPRSRACTAMPPPIRRAW